MEIKLKGLDEDIKRMIKKLDLTDDKIHKDVKQMITEATDKLQEESILRSPFDEGFLQASHERKIEDKKTKVQGHVYIPANSPASDYALYMHERIYNLGKHSLEKQAKVDVVVGRKYLERAFTENTNKFKLFFIKKLKRIFK